MCSRPTRRSRRRALPSNAEEVVDVPATPADLEAVHAALARFWSALESSLPVPPSEDWRARFTIAVAEVGANIVRHAYTGTEPVGRMRLCLRGYSDRVEARFSDRGVPFSAPIDAAGIDSLDLAESGRGLALARAAVDRVEHVRTAAGLNRWRLVKRFSG